MSILFIFIAFYADWLIVKGLMCFGHTRVVRLVVILEIIVNEWLNKFKT